ncbi:MAG: aspartate/glutamate racemase family protein [Bacteroidetes bacterium]|nr:aspartate/glutamate racemase family protein [Bacteroidota bacterium]
MSWYAGLFILVSGVAVAMSPDEQDQRLAALRAQDSITVLVIDSGLGGLSVSASIDHRAQRSSCHRSIDLVFANALPDAARGYNTMSSMDEKAAVFSEALRGMTAMVHPDVILIACNTLSVVYPHTAFARTTEIPVVGIVDIGVKFMADRLRQEKDAILVLFGTETTIGEDSHRVGLRKEGIAEDQMTTQACPDLAGEIQSDPDGDVARTMIDLYAAEAAGTISRRTSKTLVGLCCTHYGYVADRFAEAMRSSAGGVVEILDPNERMADVLFPAGCETRFTNTKVTQRVLSRVRFSDAEITAIARLVESKSQGSANALRMYQHTPDLFGIKNGP